MKSHMWCAMAIGVLAAILSVSLWQQNRDHPMEIRPKDDDLVKWVKVAPVEPDETSRQWIESGNPYSEGQAMALVLILKKYSELHVYVSYPSPTIWISRDLRAQPELLWNYQTKAAELIEKNGLRP